MTHDAIPVTKEELELLYGLLLAASHALRSYQYGNSATDLAEDLANKIDIVIDAARKEPK